MCRLWYSARPQICTFEYSKDIDDRMMDEENHDVDIEVV